MIPAAGEVAEINFPIGTLLSWINHPPDKAWYEGVQKIRSWDIRRSPYTRGKRGQWRQTQEMQDKFKHSDPPGFEFIRNLPPDFDAINFMFEACDLEHPFEAGHDDELPTVVDRLQTSVR